MLKGEGFRPPQEEKQERKEIKESLVFESTFRFSKESKHGDNTYSLVLEAEKGEEFIRKEKKLIINYTDGSQEDFPIFDWKIFFDTEEGKEVSGFQIK